MEKKVTEYKKINTIRYMGNKDKLLDYILPEIESVTKKGDIVCDIMAGTNSIGYALLDRNRIISNDVQYYSYVIGMSLLKTSIVNRKQANKDLMENIQYNLNCKVSTYFLDNYSDTYFSRYQCLEIDSIRWAIKKITKGNKNYYNYLVALMHAMCQAESTTGHFAQYLDKKHYRVQTLRKLSVIKLFFDYIDVLEKKDNPKFKNEIYNEQYEKLFKSLKKRKIACYYLDPPYTNDQYSRFYHLLETVSINDEPEYEHKAKYRKNRFMSKFCYKKNVLTEFEKIIKFTSEQKTNLIISYSNKGVCPIDDLLKMCKKYYNKTELKKIEYKHSSQGKGYININEVIIILKY